MLFLTYSIRASRTFIEMAVVRVRRDMEQSEEVNRRMTGPIWQGDGAGMLAGWRGE